jgi:dynein heavy chain, axonemal
MGQLMEKQMEEFCSVSSKGVKLALYWEVVEHIARLCRVLRMTQGHALLMGVGGTGRQSLARLAAFIQGLDIFQISISKGCASIAGK